MPILDYAIYRDDGFPRPFYIGNVPLFFKGDGKVEGIFIFSKKSSENSSSWVKRRILRCFAIAQHDENHEVMGEVNHFS